MSREKREGAPAQREAILSLAFDIRRPPEAVRRWWLEFPDDYRASDPDEQPYRIRVLERTPQRLVVLTSWRGPLGVPLRLRETLGIGSGSRWNARMQMMGLGVSDEFQGIAAPEGTHLTIRSTVTPISALGRIMRPVVARFLLGMMKRVWKDAARICERDAR